jgi:hypothetical protein
VEAKIKAVVFTLASSRIILNRDYLSNELGNDYKVCFRNGKKGLEIATRNRYLILL